MDKKYRVNELAKDLNIPVSEITDVVQEYFGCLLYTSRCV